MFNQRIKDIFKKLNNKDINEIKNSTKTNYVSFPRLGADGRILPSQWKSWQNLQRWGLGYIKGDYESGEMQLSEFGKEIAKELK